MKKIITCLLAALGLTSACGQSNYEAANKLVGFGYQCVNLKGGIMAWKGANMSIDKS